MNMCFKSRLTNESYRTKLLLFLSVMDKLRGGQREVRVRSISPGGSIDKVYTLDNIMDEFNSEFNVS